MIEKVTLHLTEASKLAPADDIRCEDMNPKALMLYAAAKCAGQTALYIMSKEHIRPKHFEISVSGELPTDTVHTENTYQSFHVVYNVECASQDDQVKISRAVRLAHDKYCSMLQMLRMIAPVSQEIAMVSTEPAKA